MGDLTLLIVAGLGGLAIVVSKIVRRFVPEIVVFLLLGILIGPDGPIELINDNNIRGLELLTQEALAAIIFLIGDRLRIDDLRNLKRLLLPLNAAQLIASGALVFVVLEALGVDTRVALLLAVIAAETGVLTVTATVKEEKAAGGFTDVVLSSVALTNVAVAAVFGLAFPFILAASGEASTPGAIVGVFAQIVLGSVAIGLLGGLLLKTYGPAIETSGELLLFLLIVLTGMTGAAIAIDGSVVVTALVAGLFVANAAPPIVLGSIVVFELSGPLLMRRVLRVTGDAGSADHGEDPVLPDLDITRSIRTVLIPVGAGVPGRPGTAGPSTSAYLRRARAIGATAVDSATSATAAVSWSPADGDTPRA